MPIRRVDTTFRCRGWQTLAAAVAEIREDLRNQGIEPVIAVASWTLPGEISFYLPDHPTVYSLGLALGDRHSQYDLWRPNPLSDADVFRDKTFIVVGGYESQLTSAFENVERTRIVDHREGKHLITQWAITICHGYRGFANLPDGKH
jgi:hypothetical protein